MSREPLQSKARKLLAGVNYAQYGLGIALVVIFSIFSILTRGRSMTAMNVNNLLMQNSYVVILAIGMLLCLLVGCIDLSVGSVVGLVGALCAILIVKLGVPLPLAILSGIALGLVIGAFQGFFIAYVKIPAFIVTLAGMLMFRGFCLIILQSQTVGPLPSAFVKIGAGFVPQFFAELGGQRHLDLVMSIGAIVASLLLVYSELRKQNSKRKHNLLVPNLWQVGLVLLVTIGILVFVSYKLASHQGSPIVLVILIVLVLVYSFLTQRTIAGRQIYAVGGNADAARLSGINTRKVIFWVYVNMGVLGSLAGIVLAARNASGAPAAGTGFELDAIAACFIGGTSTRGGIGTIGGIVIGALIMGVLNNGMSLMGIDSNWQQVVKGVVLLGAVSFDLYSKSRKPN